jgi:hypothetical protein
MDKSLQDSSSQETKYHFPEFQEAHNEAEPDSPEPAEASPALKRFASIKRKHITTFLVLLLLGWSSYLFLRHLFSSPSLKSTQSPATALTKKSESTLLKPAPTAPSPSVLEQKPAVIHVATEKASETVSMIEAVKQHLSLIEKRLIDIQAYLDRLTTTKFAAFQVRLDAINKQFDSTIQPIKQWLQQQALQTRQNVVQKSQLPKPVYYVHACSPGPAPRAWLTTSDEETITLSIGDVLPGYGTIQRIDTSQNVVYFNTGAVIGPNPNDR